MHLESFYIDPDGIDGDSLTFSGDEARHLGRSLRKRPGDRVWAVDGLGTAYEVELNQFTRQEISGRIVRRRRRLGEPMTHLTLAQGVLRGDRFDWVVEKAVELGASRIIPVIGGTTDVQAGPGKVARWKRVALAAMKQSGRCVLPEVSEPMPLVRVLRLGADCRFRLVAHPGKESRQIGHFLKDERGAVSRVLALVGSEGGFLEEELKEAKEQGYQAVHLGPRRLRGETAGLVMTSLVMSHLGEML